MDQEPDRRGDPSAKTVDLRPSGPDASNLDDELAGVQAQVLALALRMDDLWRSATPDGELAVRMVEASHALHRAAVALLPEGVTGLAAPDAPLDISST